MRLSLAATMEAAAPTNLEPEAATLGPDAPVLDDLPTGDWGSGVEAPRYVPGQVLGERYALRARLGAGAMGEVWRAYDLKLRIELALKTVLTDWSDSAMHRETLRQEVRTAREVISPNVCRVFELVELDGIEVVSMEYVDGTTLVDVIRRRGPLPLDQARDIATQLLAGLEAIHRAGLVHRDLKPENVMVTRAGRVVVMDFGIAKGLADTGGTVAGTPAYMAPEQLRGEPLDPRSDLFAAAVLLSELVDPDGVRSTADRERVHRAVRAQPPELSESPWRPVLVRGLAADREDRYPDAASLARALQEVTLRSAAEDGDSPYPGLAAFSRNEARFFHGREIELEGLWRKLRRPHLVGLIGASGLGKSSFLHAGLLATMPAGWSAAVCQPGGAPFTALAAALTSACREAEVGGGEAAGDTADGLVTTCRAWRASHEATLLVVDQFEELFTLSDAEVQGGFADLLGRLAVEADTYVLLSMRDDFVARCAQQDALAPVFSDLTALRPLSGASLQRALVEPALRCGYHFEDEAMVESMLADVGTGRGALPLLAFAAARLWEHRDRDRGLLPRAAYEEIGGVAGALAQHAEQTLDRLGRGRVAVVRELFRNLTTAEGTRATRERQELLSVFDGDGAGPGVEGAAEVLDALIEARLLVSYRRGGNKSDEGGDRIEIIHESLLENWPRLVRWRTQDAELARVRDELRQAAQQWQEHERAEDHLWTGTAYRELELFEERYSGGLSRLEKAFVSAARRLAQRRRRRRRALATGVVAASLAVAAVTATLWRRAETARAQARQEALRAEASKLVALGQVLLEEHPTAALAHALASLELDDTEVGRLFALEALWHGPPVRVASAELSLLVRFSEDGSRLGAGGRGRFDVWGVEGGAPIVVPGHSASVTPVAFRGDLLLSSERRGAATVQLYDLARAAPGPRHDVGHRGYLAAYSCDGTERVLIMDEEVEGVSDVRLSWWTPHTGGVETIGSRPLRSGWQAWQPSPSCAALAVTPWGSGQLQLIPVAEFGGEAHVVQGRLQEPIGAIAFDDAGRRIAAAGVEGSVTIWNAARPGSRPLRQLAGGPGAMSMGFSPTDRHLAVGTRDHEVLLWDLDASEAASPRVLRAGATGYVWGVDFDPTGRWLAAGTPGGTCLWPLDARYPRVLRGHEGPVQALAFVDGGRMLVSGGDDGSLRAWGVEPGMSVPAPLSGLGVVWGLAVDPGGRRLVLPNVGLVVSLADKPSLRGLTGMEPNIFGAAIDRTGRWVALGGTEEARIGLWDLESESQGDLPMTGELDAGDGMAVQALAYLDDGRLLSGGAAGLRLWDVEQGTWTQAAEGATRGMALGRDGRRVARLLVEGGSISTVGGRLSLEELDTGASIPLPQFGGELRSIALHPDGEIVVAGGMDGRIRVGRVDGAAPHLLLGHEGPVTAVAVSPDGAWIASAGQDTTVRLWPMPDVSRTPLHVLPHDQLLATLRSLTNLRLVQDPEADQGWRLDLAPFPGWSRFPDW